ncbi:MAG: hypothetical protein QOF91_1229 [Alphaproteobacteria bacterium]|nr:hypothetical protein [Alphaproteobacteria bacterium]
MTGPRKPFRNIVDDIDRKSIEANAIDGVFNDRQQKVQQWMKANDFAKSFDDEAYWSRRGGAGRRQHTGWRLERVKGIEPSS